MKNFIWFAFTLVALTMLSCQEEANSVVQDTSNSFSKTSPISSLIKRVSQYDTTADNVIDGTSNCSMKLPLFLVINNQYVYVIDSNDFQQVEMIKNSYPGDDVVHFAQFPVTMIFPDYSQYEVSSESELDYIFSHYGDDSGFRKINCLSFDFSSFKINSYNTENQVASTVTITSNEQLYNFINDLSSTQLVGIVYPISLHTAGGQTLVVNNNTQLEAAIDQAVSDCSGSTGNDPFSDIVCSGSWHVSYYYNNQNQGGNYNPDQTYLYNGYNFTFNADGTVVAIKNSYGTNGDWEYHESKQGFPRLELHFDGNMLNNLESSDWDIQEYTSTYLRLRKEISSGGGQTQCNYLEFTKN